METVKNSSSAVHCRSCGAEYSSREACCPYCGATNPAGAESAYMDSLRGVKKDLEGLKKVTKKEMILEAREAGRFIKKVLLILLVLAALIAGFLYFQNRRQDQRERKAYAWLNENAPVLDAYYRNGEYDKLLEFYRDSLSEDVPVWNWQHFEVLDGLLIEDDLKAILQRERENGTLSENDMAWVLKEELELLCFDKRIGVSKEDAAIIMERAADYAEDFKSRFSLTDEELDQLTDRLKDGYGYIDHDDCLKFIRERK